MGLFEDIAVTDLKLRIVVAVGIVVLIGVTLPSLLILKSALGFVIGVIASLLATVITGKWVFTD